MKRILSKAIISMLLVSGLLGLSRPALAGEEHGSQHGMVPAKGAPATLADVWRSVKAHEGELDALIKAKDIGKVHQIAFAIRDLVATLPEKSGQLPAEQQTKLKGQVKYVATLADRLDTAGDAKDQSATEGAFKQLQTVLSGIEGLYPPEALK